MIGSDISVHVGEGRRHAVINKAEACARFHSVSHVAVIESRARLKSERDDLNPSVGVAALVFLLVVVGIHVEFLY